MYRCLCSAIQRSLPALVLYNPENAKTVKTAFQTGVGMDEPLHGLSVAGHDHHQVLPMILHGLEQGIDGFLPVIAATPVVSV